jgi:aryl-alcohol dehydrogenase (NADP+)
MHRSTYDGELARLCTREGLAFLPYYALAQGFLSGKYRTAAADRNGSPREDGARKLLDARGERMLREIDRIAAARHTTPAAVALAWLRGQPNVVAPIASARTKAQLLELLPMATLELSPEELRALTVI